MPISDRIEAMLRMIRTWYILWSLRRRILNKTATSDSYKIGNGYSTYVIKNKFLEYIAKKNILGIKRSEKSKNKRMLGDSHIIETCVKQQPQKIIEKKAKDLGSSDNKTLNNKLKSDPKTRMITITGAGAESADLSNVLTEFLNKYKVIGIILISIFSSHWIIELFKAIFKIK